MSKYLEQELDRLNPINPETGKRQYKHEQFLAPGTHLKPESTDCYCFGPPVDDCPTHGAKPSVYKMHMIPTENMSKVIENFKVIADKLKASGQKLKLPPKGWKPKTIVVTGYWWQGDSNE